MKRLRRVLMLVLALIALASVSFTASRSLVILDDAERPVEGGYLAYHHEGRRLNPVHPTTYRAGHPALLRSNTSGRIRIPAALHVHLPFPLATHPTVVVDLVYAPRLHNASASVRKGASSVEGVFVIDWRKGRFLMTDVASHPERWERTLSDLRWAMSSFGPEEERQRWRKMTDDQLAKEPTWGPLVQRTFGRELAALAAFEGELRGGR